MQDAETTKQLVRKICENYHFPTSRSLQHSLCAPLTATSLENIPPVLTVEQSEVTLAWSAICVQCNSGTGKTSRIRSPEKLCCFRRKRMHLLHVRKEAFEIAHEHSFVSARVATA